MQPRRAAVLALLAVTQLIGVLDFSIVNVALPSIQSEFDLAPDQLQWVVSAYALTLGGFLLLGGRIADLVDRKLVFMLGLSVFTAASLAGGLAPTANLVFVARAVQGVGGAVLAPTALALVTAEFAEGDERNRALSVFGTVAALGFTAGVILGGALTGFAGWRWVFFVNVPIALATLIAAAGLLQPQRREGARPRLDLAGAILATAPHGRPRGRPVAGHSTGGRMGAGGSAAGPRGRSPGRLCRCRALGRGSPGTAGSLPPPGTDGCQRGGGADDRRRLHPRIHADAGGPAGDGLLASPAWHFCRPGSAASSAEPWQGLECVAWAFGGPRSQRWRRWLQARS